MAQSNQPNATMVAMIVFIMLSIGLGVTTYLFHRDLSTASADAKAARAEVQAKTTQLKKLDDDLQALKVLIGHKFEKVEDASRPDDTSTVAGAMRDDLKKLDAKLSQPTYSASLLRLKEELETVVADRDSVRTNLEKEHKDLLALLKQYTDRSDMHDGAKVKAETDLRGQISKTDESLRAKDTEISRLRNEKQQITIEKDNEIDALTKDVKVKVEETKRLSALNLKLSEELDTVKKVSFEVPDGKIRRVDNDTRKVYIDLGERDKLKVRTTFSVYSKDNFGVGRGAEDIKGKIEVTRILGSDLAEATILEEQLTRPISAGDFIYTPLWSSGRIERFAFIGIIDLDGDGKSDRQQLREVLANSGASVQTEVDDEGVRDGGNPRPIDENTKFLVMGQIPSVGATATDEERAIALKIADQLKDLRTEARENGVRVLPLNDFLSQLGYKAKQRLFSPGDNRPYQLKAGSSGNSPVRPPVSDGQVSGAISTKRRLPPPVSSGKTSQLFEGPGK